MCLWIASMILLKINVVLQVNKGKVIPCEMRTCRERRMTDMEVSLYKFLTLGTS